MGKSMASGTGHRRLGTHKTTVCRDRSSAYDSICSAKDIKDQTQFDATNIGSEWIRRNEDVATKSYSKSKPRLRERWRSKLHKKEEKKSRISAILGKEFGKTNNEDRKRAATEGLESIKQEIVTSRNMLEGAMRSNTNAISNQLASLRLEIKSNREAHTYNEAHCQPFSTFEISRSRHGLYNALVDKVTSLLPSNRRRVRSSSSASYVESDVTSTYRGSCRSETSDDTLVDRAYSSRISELFEDSNTGVWPDHLSGRCELSSAPSRRHRPHVAQDRSSGPDPLPTIVELDGGGFHCDDMSMKAMADARETESENHIGVSLVDPSMYAPISTDTSHDLFESYPNLPQRAFSFQAANDTYLTTSQARVAGSVLTGNAKQANFLDSVEIVVSRSPNCSLRSSTKAASDREEKSFMVPLHGDASSRHFRPLTHYATPESLVSPRQLAMDRQPDLGSAVTMKSCNGGSRQQHQQQEVISQPVITASRSAEASRKRTCTGKPQSRRKYLSDSGHSDSESVSQTSVTSEAIRLLACPFFLKDRRRHRDCANLKITEVARLKQHIRRVHKIPIYCGRCYQQFGTQDALGSHARQAVRCSEGTPVTWDCTTEQLNQLTIRIPTKLPLREQYNCVYNILFPGEQVPESPFLDVIQSQELRDMVDFADAESASIIEEVLPSLHEAHRQFAQDPAGFVQAIGQRYLHRAAERWSRFAQDGSSAVPSPSSSGANTSRKHSTCPSRDVKTKPLSDRPLPTPRIKRKRKSLVSAERRDHQPIVSPCSAGPSASTESRSPISPVPTHLDRTNLEEILDFAPVPYFVAKDLTYNHQQSVALQVSTDWPTLPRCPSPHHCADASDPFHGVSPIEPFRCQPLSASQPSPMMRPWCRVTSRASTPLSIDTRSSVIVTPVIDKNLSANSLEPSTTTSLPPSGSSSANPPGLSPSSADTQPDTAATTVSGRLNHTSMRMPDHIPAWDIPVFVEDKPVEGSEPLPEIVPEFDWRPLVCTCTNYFNWPEVWCTCGFASS